jgi:hypothetical protein
MGARGGEFKWQGEMMEESEARATWRVHGKAMSVKLGTEREEKIGKEKCDICMVVWRECDWPEAHFSSKTEWVAFCNEVCWNC